MDRVGFLVQQSKDATFVERTFYSLRCPRQNNKPVAQNFLKSLEICCSVIGVYLVDVKKGKLKLKYQSLHAFYTLLLCYIFLHLPYHCHVLYISLIYQFLDSMLTEFLPHLEALSKYLLNEEMNDSQRYNPQLWKSCCEVL